MNRLPTYDGHTSRSERYLFLGLSLAAATLIVITAADAWQFSSQREEMTATLSKGRAVPVAKSITASTNLAASPGSPGGERSRLDGPVRPKS